jgi:hypothetical protein
MAAVVAYFFNRLAEHYGIEFNSCARTLAAQIAQSDEHEREILNRLMKDNIGLVTVLEVLLPGNSQRGNNNNNGGNNNRRGAPTLVAVANTHLYSNKDFPDVKLWQCLTMIRELEQLVRSRDLPLVICGDFNSVPSSAVINGWPTTAKKMVVVVVSVVAAVVVPAVAAMPVRVSGMAVGLVVAVVVESQIGNSEGRWRRESVYTPPTFARATSFVNQSTHNMSPPHQSINQSTNQHKPGVRADGAPSRRA